MSEDPNITLPEASPLLWRLLNIASIVCLAACVALMGMWVRSYYRTDQIEGPMAGYGCRVDLVPGRLMFGAIALTKHFFGGNDSMHWSADSHKANRFDAAWIVVTSPGILNELGFFAGHLWQTGWGLIVPYWFLTLSTGSSAMLLRMRWPPQFTLRSMFIATTFLAVVLGMIAWLDRAWIGK